MLYTLVLFLFLPLPTFSSTTSKRSCGGHLEAPRGVIATPNFPHKFRTPIHCQWSIDTQHIQQHDAPLTIKLYLTQLYVQEGLTITEYNSIHEYDYNKLSGVQTFMLNEDDVTSNKTYIEVKEKEYLIIDFRLERLESTHLRVLDGLLNVFGFNITYEITSGPARSNRCSMKLCGFTGYCYDDFTHFRCDCFPGFHGRQCSEGPKSKCIVDGQPSCDNGAECLHAGHTAYVCDCKKGFVGSFCQHRIRNTLVSTSGCTDCLISCKFNGTMEDVCRCNRNEISNNLKAINESIGYLSRIFVQSKLNVQELRETLKRNILDAWRTNITKLNDVKILLTNTGNNETDVTLRFYAPKLQDELIRSTIRKWGRQQYGHRDKNYTLIEKDIMVKSEPYLYLENVAIDKSGPISEGDEFVLSCTARGSKDMIFRWFKDNVLVNITSATNNKWENLISKGRNTDHYTALLGVRNANRFDRGTFTCHVEDYGIQQCRSLHVEMIHQPQIKLEPASLTVDKGQPFTIKCISLASYGEKYTFSWAKDKHLLPIKTEYEHYEILYPGGSILQVSRLNKTTTYSCIAHLGKLSTESTLVVNVVDKQVVRPCPAEHFETFAWPETAPGGECKQECPDNYFGMTTRSCIMLENGEPKWLMPDHSNCTQMDLMHHLRDFRYLEESYAKTTPLNTLINIKAYMNGSKLLRGEGRVVLYFIERIVRFNNASFGYSDHTATTDVMLEILDVILGQNISLNKEQQVVTLQKLVRNQLMILSSHTSEPYLKQLTNIQVSIEIDEIFLNPSRIIRVNYQNLYEFLTKKSVIRLNYSDDREMKYELFAGVTSIWRWQRAPVFPQAASERIAAVFNHRAIEMDDDTPSPSKSKGAVKCVLAEYAASDYVWDTSKCRVVYTNATTVRCECDDEGTMTILVVDDIKTERAERQHLTVRDEIVLVGCAIAFVTCTFTGVLLSISWCRHKSTMTFLKAQCALSIAGCMLLFVLGFSDSISKRFYLNVLSGLLIFYLTALSSQLSTLLIIFTELIEMQKITSIKQTVVGIITGAPIIAVFTNHLTHQIKDIPLSHWWIVRDTLSFYISIVCITVVFILYVILCCLVSKLIKTDKSKNDTLLHNRSTMMTKSTLIFTIVTISAGTSVACVNFPDDIIWRYTFTGTSIVMGLIIMVCLVFKVQTFTKKYLLETLHKGRPSKPGKDGKLREHHISRNKCESNNETLENGSPTIGIEEYNASPTQYNATLPVCKSNSLNSPDILGTKVFAELDLVASSLQSDVQRSAHLAMTNDDQLQNINNIANIDKNIEKTLNNSKLSMGCDCATFERLSPVKLQKTDKCVTFCDKIEYDTNVNQPTDNSPNENDVVVGSNVDNSNISNIAVISESETSETDTNGNGGSNRSNESNGSEGSTANNLDEVMDSISNDLKYLLNGHQFVDPINTISC